jgi:hypothetical protein
MPFQPHSRTPLAALEHPSIQEQLSGGEFRVHSSFLFSATESIISIISLITLSQTMKFTAALFGVLCGVVKTSSYDISNVQDVEPMDQW